MKIRHAIYGLFMAATAALVGGCGDHSWTPKDNDLDLRVNSVQVTDIDDNGTEAEVSLQAEIGCSGRECGDDITEAGVSIEADNAPDAFDTVTFNNGVGQVNFTLSYRNLRDIIAENATVTVDPRVDHPDINSRNNSISISFNVGQPPVQVTDLILQSLDLDSAEVISEDSGEITERHNYRLTIYNRGNADLSDVDLALTLPTFALEPDQNLNISSLPKNGVTTFSFPVDYKYDKELGNPPTLTEVVAHINRTGMVKENNTDNNEITQRFNVFTTVTPADVSIGDLAYEILSLDAQKATVKYTVTVSNTGNIDVRNLEVMLNTSRATKETRFVTLPHLEPEQSQTVEFTDVEYNLSEGDNALRDHIRADVDPLRKIEKDQLTRVDNSIEFDLNYTLSEDEFSLNNIMIRIVKKSDMRREKEEDGVLASGREAQIDITIANTSDTESYEDARLEFEANDENFDDIRFALPADETKTISYFVFLDNHELFRYSNMGRVELHPYARLYVRDPDGYERSTGEDASIVIGNYHTQINLETHITLPGCTGQCGDSLQLQIADASGIEPYHDQRGEFDCDSSDLDSWCERWDSLYVLPSETVTVSISHPDYETFTEDVTAATNTENQTVRIDADMVPR